MTDPIKTIRLRNESVEITLLSMGCSVQEWRVHGRSVVLGYANPEAYRENPACMGAICGRVINRIGGARFDLDGQTWRLPANLPPHHLHGGPRGAAWRNWTVVSHDATQAVLSLHSPHLDQGYPGDVDTSVTLRLDGYRLTYDIAAQVDRKTILNYGQHLYFNLSGAGPVRSHTLLVDADDCTPTDDLGLPTGERMAVDGSRFDFREPTPLCTQDPDAVGYDLNYALNRGSGPAAVLTHNDLDLRLWTDRPGLQIYTANGLEQTHQPLPGQSHQPYSGICLEAQDFPNAPNRPDFGSVLYTPDHPYRQRTTIEIAPRVTP
ncbi:aldose epimerase family protein [Cognatishimia sp. F0-27]|uniref:aldose epimerase family protein n=1 Tax=Cognatishimia sp. F0-27 TaxID=2816855 RepID=UPI001D0C8236|nr:galactose mutarotase [Cognatishimia sp. F0-27]